MDYQNNSNYNNGYNNFNQYNPNGAGSFYNKRSSRMEIAALVLGIVAIASCTCLYVSIICGSLSMMFALLSKGGASSMSSRAMFCFALGLVSVILTLTIYTFSFIFLIKEYGSLQGILAAYSEMSGIDYTDLIQQMNAGY